MRIALLAGLLACGGSPSEAPAESAVAPSTGPSAAAPVDAPTVTDVAPTAEPHADLTDQRRAVILEKVLQQSPGTGMIRPDGKRSDPKIDRIDRVMMDARSRFKACFIAYLKSHPGGSGKGTASFTVEPNGHVSAATARGFQASLETCIVGIVEKLMFSPAEVASKVNYPLSFYGQ